MKPSARTDPAVDAYLRELRHPRKAELATLRQILLDASPKISEGIKWNAPSFKTSDWFATINLRTKDGVERVWLVLHAGAKVKKSAAAGLQVADPQGLLQWLAKDRALVTFADAKELRARRAPLQALVRAWIGQL